MITIPKFKNKYKQADYKVAELMAESLWNRYCHNQGPTSLPYWMDKFSNQKQANRMILALAKKGMIKTTIKHNWAEVEINEEYLLTMYTRDELNETIKSTKLLTYLPQLADTAVSNPAFADTKVTSGVKDTGLARFGFAEAGQKHSFKYDTEMMEKYKPYIIKYSVKSMKKMEAKLKKSLRVPAGYDYESIIESAIDMIIAEKEESYILGKLTNDSRGRAIYECLRTIFNPLANKMARALVVAPPERPSKKGVEAAYLCMAELYSGFNGDIASKVNQGKMCYKVKRYHKLNLDPELKEQDYKDLWVEATRAVDNDETIPHNKKEESVQQQYNRLVEDLKYDKSELDDLFENIWLERLYNDMRLYHADEYHMVTTPLEVDFSSSNMVMIGLLLGHWKYVDHTKYMWDVAGLSKQHVKFAQTPYVFGSREGVIPLWDKNNLTYTPEQVKLMKYEQSAGKFAMANELKDIIVGHCQPDPEMEVCVQHEVFKVECNKTRNVGDTTKQYIVYNTDTHVFEVIHHTDTHTVPDLERFKTYFMTLLIHNLDSQILDNIVMKMNWVLPIHDAGIVTWNGAVVMRAQAVVEMEFVKDNREKTMLNYLKSIKLDQAGWIRYAKLKEKVAKANEEVDDIELSPFLLK